MKLVVGIPALGQNETLQKNIDLLIANADNKPTIVVWDNGSETAIPQDDSKYTLIRSEKNVGVPKAMNNIMEAIEADYYMMIHSDVEIYEKGWDTILIETIEEINSGDKKVGVIGGYGSMQMGADDINITPYNKWQVGRAYNMAGNKIRLPREHGFKEFPGIYFPCITLDGYWLTVKSDIRFWDNAPHHMYDHDVCMESIDKGYTNWTLNIDHDHQGGVSVCRENWTRDFQYTGDEIHDLASSEFYNKWKHKLPMKHESVANYY